MFKCFGYALLTGLLPLNPAAAQELERMETDRPDQTECPFIVPKKWIQAEWGFNFEKTNPTLNTYLYPTLLTKYGVHKKWELRLITTMIAERENRMTGLVANAGLEPVEVGFKTALLEEKGVIPKTSLIAHIAIPTLSSAKFKTEKWAPNFVFTMQHTISSTLAVGYNLGATWNGFNNIPSWLYRISPGCTIGKQWYAYVEAFGFIQKNETANHNIDGGLAYYVSNNCKLDLSAGKGLSSSSVNFYAALGVSFRFKL